MPRAPKFEGKKPLPAETIEILNDLIREYTVESLAEESSLIKDTIDAASKGEELGWPDYVSVTRMVNEFCQE